MRKLLSANFHALRHSKRFWLLGLLMVASAVYSVCNLYRLKSMGWVGGIDRAIIENLPILFLIMPAMVALFINTDYHDGTIRNKITVGCTRVSVYLANLITSYIITFVYAVIHIGLVLLIGFPLGFNDPKDVAGKVVMFMVVMLPLMAIAVFLATMISNRSVLVLSVLMTFAMIFGAQFISEMLLNPEQIPDYNGVTMISEASDDDGTFTMTYIDQNGNPIKPEDIPIVDNPRYVKEPLRTLLRKFNNIQPGGQLMEFMQGGYRDLDENGGEVCIPVPYWETALYALAVTLAFTLAGLIIFGKKDLK